MRALTLILALVLSTAAAGQEAPQPSDADARKQSAVKPDYSRDTLLRILRDEPHKQPRAVRFRVGAVEFDALGTQWRFIYLPLMLPLSGTRLGATQQMPDPFALTQTSIAAPPRSWSEGSGLVRIVKSIGRKNVKVKSSAGQ